MQFDLIDELHQLFSAQCVRNAQSGLNIRFFEKDEHLPIDTVSFKVDCAHDIFQLVVRSLLVTMSLTAKVFKVG